MRRGKAIEAGLAALAMLAAGAAFAEPGNHGRGEGGGDGGRGHGGPGGYQGRGGFGVPWGGGPGGPGGRGAPGGHEGPNGFGGPWGVEGPGGRVGPDVRGARGAYVGRGPAGAHGRVAPPAAEMWDERRHDGYWAGGRWFFGPPPEGAYAAPDFRPGFAPWRRGGYLPPYYQGDVVEDYPRFHLRRPPPGYHWVRAGGAYLLVSASTGLIFDIIQGF